MSAIAKYLQHYAEPESQWLDGFTPLFNYCLAIPMYRESSESLAYFCQFAAQQQHCLLLVVLNRPDTDNHSQWAQQLIAPLGSPDWQSSNQLLRYHALANHSGLLVIDRCLNGPPIPQRQGVGLARKIANDIACQLIARQQIQRPWIANTDADARLPEDYFSSCDTVDSTKSAAILFAYQHIAGEQDYVHTATQLYELSLTYYVAGLSWAGSPYAYHTLGSIMAVNYKHYAQVRGFPKRAGAEDFYLLNKLAKTAAITSLQQPSIAILSRASSRVPFGTGPAVQQIIDSGDYAAMPFYHPAIFHYLRAALTIIALLTHTDDINAALNSITDPAVDNALLEKALNHFDISKALSHTYRHGKSSQQRLQHLTVWFDAFKTLKFLHFIRDNDYPMMPYQQWVSNVQQYAFGQPLNVLRLPISKL
ncbi:hypothetical protein [Dasania marina]|uniref:hypothetical protein n=1 Tax=Dasania marina TaxID=471499 RepID=UPI000363DEF3|nr:hypothetical protein [Dasania marina]